MAHRQTPVIAQPAEGAFHDPAASIAPQCATILCRRTNAILLVRADQFDAALPQPFSQRIAVVGLVGNHAQRLLPRAARTMASAYADRGERRLRELDFCRGCTTKVVSQRNTRAFDHHHPLRPLAPLPEILAVRSSSFNSPLNSEPFGCGNIPPSQMA
jgi:hypothetical protein